MATSSKKQTSTASHSVSIRPFSQWLSVLDSVLLVALAVALFLQAVQVSRLQAQVRVAQQGVAVLRSNDQMFDSAIVAMARELGMMPEAP